MELFSLEDDDCNQLFITQSSNEKKLSEENAESLDQPNDFGRPCCLLTQPQYEDISRLQFWNSSFSRRGIRRKWRCLGKYTNWPAHYF